MTDESYKKLEVLEAFAQSRDMHLQYDFGPDGDIDSFRLRLRGELRGIADVVFIDYMPDDHQHAYLPVETLDYLTEEARNQGCSAIVFARFFDGSAMYRLFKGNEHFEMEGDFDLNCYYYVGLRDWKKI
jgi:hypothetical protein